MLAGNHNHILRLTHISSQTFCRTDLPNDELLPILESIAVPSKLPVGDGAVAEATGDAPKPATSAVDRKLINLQKKLQKIEELKAKKAKGEKLEKNQVDKTAVISY